MGGQVHLCCNAKSGGFCSEGTLERQKEPSTLVRRMERMEHKIKTVLFDLDS